MSYSKPSEKVLQNLAKRRLILKAKVDQGKVLAEGADSKFWLTYKQMFKKKLLRIEDQLDDYRTMTNEQIRDMLAQRFDLKMFISAPEDFSKDLDKMNEEIEKLDTQISEYKERLAQNV